MTTKIWNKTEGLKLANGAYRTPKEICIEYPFAADGSTIIEMAGDKVVGLHDLDIIKAVFKIDEDLSDEKALQKYVDIRDKKEKQEPDQAMRIAVLEEAMLAMMEGATNV